MYTCRHGNQVLMNEAVGAVARSKPTRDSKVGKVHGATKLCGCDLQQGVYTIYCV